MKALVKVLIALLVIGAIGGGGYFAYTQFFSKDDAPNQYTVNFNSMSGSNVASINNVEENSTITAPTAPTRTAYDFVAWYKEEALTNVWNFSSDKVTGDITLYAKWDASPVNFTTAAQLTGGRYQTAYTATTIAATANGGTVTYAIKQGSTLPAGLSHNAGQISGTVTAVPGTYTFSIVATNTTAVPNSSAEREFSITVGKKQLAKPQLNETAFVYDTTAYTVELNTLGEYALGGDVTKTNAGDNYVATVILDDTSKYEWTDGTTTALNLAWEIERGKITKPQLVTTNFKYVSGTTHNVAIDVSDARYTLGGQTSGNDYGNYTAIVELTNTAKENWTWADGTDTPLNLTWTISDERTKISKPTLSQDSFEFNNSPRTPLANGIGFTVSGDATKTDAGNYTITISISDTSEYVWADNTNAPFNLTWEIMRAKIAKPIITDNLIYNGATQTISLDTTAMYTVTGRSGLNADTYTATVTLTANYQWNSVNALEVLTLDWSIARQQIARPSISQDSHEYTGISIDILSYIASHAGYNFSGDTNGTNVDDYTLAVTLTSNYQWNSGNSLETFNLAWHITPKPIAVPTLTNPTGLVYDGTLQNPGIPTSSDWSVVTATSTTEETDAGTYTIFVTLNNPNYAWASTFNGQLVWTISPQPVGVPALSITSVTFNSSPHTVTVPSPFTLNGQTTGTNVATYTVNILLGSANYVWIGGGTAPVERTWTITPLQLSAPINLSIGGTTLTWDPVTDATDYTVNIDGTTYTAGSNTYSLSGLTTPKVYVISVRANGTGNYSNSAYSATINYTVTSTLSVPSNLQVSGTNLTWIGDSNAVDYTVDIDGTIYTASTNSYSLSGLTTVMVYSISVRANGDGTVYLTSAFSTPLNVTKPAAPANLSATNNVLTWDAVAGFSSYNVYLGLGTTPVATVGSTRQYTIPVSSLSAGNHNYSVSVAGTNSALESVRSLDYSVTKLSAPTGFAVSNHLATWSAVANATGYTISVTGGTTTTFTVTGGATTSYDLFARLVQGNYTLTITATGNGSTHLTSAASSGVSYVVTETIIGISTQTQLANITNNLSAKYALLNNIALVGNWTPIMNFAGSLDGRGYTISNLIVNTPTATTGSGLFGTLGASGVPTTTAIITNLKVDVTSINATSNIGGIVGRMYGGTVNNCEVFGTIGVATADYVGGIVGQRSSSGNVNGNTNNASIVGKDYVGGIVGYILWHDVTGLLENCENNGTVTGVTDVGGIVGRVSGTRNSVSRITSVIRNLTNNGVVIATGENTGGIVGYVAGVGTESSGTTTFWHTLSVNSCGNNANISGIDYVGGIIGRSGANVTAISLSTNLGDITGIRYIGGYIGHGAVTQVTGATNTKTISGQSYVGGIAGQTYGVANCTNNGTINVLVGGTGDYVGGIVGYLRGSVTDCINWTNISSHGSFVGGIVGYADWNDSNLRIGDSTNHGTVTGAGSVGGIVGRIEGRASTSFRTTSRLINCTNNGVVTSSGNNVGGIAGHATGIHITSSQTQHYISFEGCVNNANVTGNDYVGGVLGLKGGSGVSFITATNCTNAPSATITATSGSANWWLIMAP